MSSSKSRDLPQTTIVTPDYAQTHAEGRCPEYGCLLKKHPGDHSGVAVILSQGGKRVPMTWGQTIVTTDDAGCLSHDY